MKQIRFGLCLKGFRPNPKFKNTDFFSHKTRLICAHVSYEVILPPVSSRHWLCAMVVPVYGATETAARMVHQSLGHVELLIPHMAKITKMLPPRVSLRPHCPPHLHPGRQMGVRTPVFRLEGEWVDTADRLACDNGCHPGEDNSKATTISQVGYPICFENGEIPATVLDRIAESCRCC